MKHNHHLTIAAVLLVGCGNPDDALNQAAFDGNIEAVKKHLASGVNVDAKDKRLRKTPQLPTLRKHGAKTGEELKAEGK